MFKLLTRTVVVLWRLLPIILSFVRDFQRYVFWGTGRALTEAQHEQRAKHLTHTLGVLGPTFIKLAQVLSARADVLPRLYITELSTLQDRVPPNPTAEIKAMIEQALHAPVETIFDDFDHQPLAAASLGQVHRARYHGDEVVVKVLRPRVPRLIHTDLAIIHGVLNLLNTFISYSPFLRSLTTALNEFHRVILEEIDFQREARNLQIFRRNLAHEEFVLIPRLYPQLTATEVIVMEYLEGVKINNIAELERMGVDIPLVIQRLARLYIRQVMIDGFLHADPHPGNILINRQSRIIILDFGMVVRIDEAFKRRIIRYAVAIANHDVNGMVNAMYDLNLVEPGTNKAALRDLAELMLEIQEKGKISSHKVQEMTSAFMEAFYEFPFTLPPELVYIARAASLMEGLGFIHDPWFDAVAVGRPVIQDIAQEMLQEELQGDWWQTLQKWAVQSYQTVTALHDIILKTDREQLRLRLHPADLQSMSTIMGRVTRRLLSGMCALLVGLTALAFHLRSGSTLILVGGLGIVGLWMLILMLLPDKRPDVTYRHYIRRHLARVTSEDGELYKSFVMGQMTPEEREQSEAQRQSSTSASDTSS